MPAKFVIESILLREDVAYDLAVRTEGRALAMKIKEYLKNCEPDVNSDYEPHPPQSVGGKWDGGLVFKATWAGAQYPDLLILMMPTSLELVNGSKAKAVNVKGGIGRTPDGQFLLMVKNLIGPCDLRHASTRFDIFTFVHEFIHYKDAKRGSGMKPTAAASVGRDWDTYYNDPGEFNAYFQELATSLDGLYKPDSALMTSERRDDYLTWDKFLEVAMKIGGWHQHYKPKYRKKFLKRLRALYDHLRDKLVVNARTDEFGNVRPLGESDAVRVVRTTAAKIWKSQMANSNMCYDVLKSATGGDVNGELLLYMIQQVGQNVGWVAVDSDGPTLLLIYVRPDMQQQGIGLKALQAVFNGQPFEAEAVSDEGDALIRKYRAASHLGEAQLGLPVLRKNRVWHVGSLNKPRRTVGGTGNEGDGLPVSEHPEDWRSIARLGSQKAWELTKPGGVFVDALRVLRNKRTMRMIHEWAKAEGLAEPSAVYRVHFNNEDGDDVFFEFTDKAEAEDEASFEDGRRLEVVADGLKAAPALQDWFQAFAGRALPSALLDDMLIFRYAEQSGCDGVWWNETHDPAGLSAPRGTVFQSKLSEWSRS